MLHLRGASDRVEQLCFEKAIYNIANRDHRSHLLEEGGRTNVDFVASPASDDVALPGELSPCGDIALQFVLVHSVCWSIHRGV